MGERIIYFDMDGTVADSQYGLIAAIREGFLSVGMEPPAEAELYQCLGPPLTTALEMFFGITGDTAKRIVDGFRVCYWDKGLIDGFRLYPGVAELIIGLHGRGETLAVASAKQARMSERQLRTAGLDHCFKYVCGAQPSERTEGKSVILSRAALEHGMTGEAAARCFMIGDRGSDVEAGRLLGMRTVGVTYGYGSRAELEAAGADFIAEDAAELARILE